MQDACNRKIELLYTCRCFNILSVFSSVFFKNLETLCVFEALYTSFPFSKTVEHWDSQIVPKILSTSSEPYPTQSMFPQE